MKEVKLWVIVTRRRIYSKSFLLLQKLMTFTLPNFFLKKGAFSDTDLVRYGRITSPEEIVLDRKSRFSPKEVLLPISQTLFYFTEDKVTEPNPPQKGRGHLP